MNKRQKKKAKQKLLMMCHSLKHGCYHKNKVNERMYDEYYHSLSYREIPIHGMSDDIQDLIEMGIFTKEEAESKISYS